MATVLYHLGRGAFRWRWLVALFWVVVLAVIGIVAARAPAAADEGFKLPGAESQRAFDLLEQRFPDAAATGARAQIVFMAPRGEKITAAKNKKAVERLVDEAADGSQVASVTDPFQVKAVSKDAVMAFAMVSFQDKAHDLTNASKDHLKGAIEHARDTGLTVEVGGTALAEEPPSGESTEAVGVAVAAVVLLITFGSLAAAGLPLLTAIVGIAVSLAAITALSSAFGLSGSTGTLAMMLGLACGIDYALFMVSRYREERAVGHDPRTAAGTAVGTAGSAVVFAGMTVVIALAGLIVVGIPLLTTMGLAAAGAVLVAVLVCLTLIPALLGFWPNAVLARRVRKNALQRRNERDNGGSRWARTVTRHPLPVLLLSVVGLGAIAVPAMDLQLGMPGAESKPTSSTERRAYDALAEGFGPGFNGPLTIVVDVKDTRNAEEAKSAVQTIEKRIGRTAGVVSVSPAAFNQAMDTAVFSVTPATSPTDQKTQDLVTSIRDERPGIEAKAAGAHFEVSGATALNIDIAQKVQTSLIPYLAVVVGLAILLLLIVFRSLLVPVKAAVGFLLSVLAALGAVVLVFQQGHGAELLGAESTGPVMSLTPIFLVGIVFGLAMDYEVFLVSRIRESYVHGDAAKVAVVSGFRHSAPVVAAAALIMIAVFAGFIGAQDALIKVIGFGLAIAVLFDAFVVRMMIVPAVLALLGDTAWYVPRWLNRLLPNIDVEGEALNRKVPAPTARDAGQEQPTELVRPR